MRRALELARLGWGCTHPDPMVGALIVEDGYVVAEGFCAQAGGAHAAKAALAKLGRAPREDAMLYVTSEPCPADGRVVPGTELIIEAGIKRVVAGATDPNPEHAGKGFEVLRAAGIDVTAGVLERECTDLNLIFNHWIAHGTPLVAAKSAVTLDGRVACRSGDARWVIGEEARSDVMRWRRLFPSLAVGAGTIMTDNPRLTVCLPGAEEWCPVRFVFDGLLRSVADRAMPSVYTDEYRERTIVVTTQHGGMGYVRKLRDLGVQVWVLSSGTQRVPMAEFRKRCAAEKILGVYLEDGTQLVSQMLQERQIDYLFIYRAPLLLADDRAKPVLGGLRTEKLTGAIRLAEVRHEVFGDDTLTRGRVAYPGQMFIDETTFSLG
jgi:diaminohydroxyphosphoribosylaminopyrimidine deaminase/5-amino-6-(5-phosphoribosylamino)uracil reductase